MCQKSKKIPERENRGSGESQRSLEGSERVVCLSLCRRETQSSMGVFLKRLGKPELSNRGVNSLTIMGQSWCPCCYLVINISWEPLVKCILEHRRWGSPAPHSRYKVHCHDTTEGMQEIKSYLIIQVANDDGLD